MISILDKNIPIAAILGGVAIAILSALSSLIGSLGSGSSLLMAVNIIYSFYEKISKSGDGYEFINTVEYWNN